MSMCYLCCGIVSVPALGLAGVLYLFFYGLAYAVKTGLHWRGLGKLYTGLALLGAFVYFTLPLVGVVITPVPSLPESLVGRDCTLVRERILDNAGPEPYESYVTIEETRVDVDGDRTFERWEQIHARTGGLDFGSAVFIYEPGELEPRWCGDVTAAQSFLQAWIKPMNLDLDLGREIWMRDASIIAFVSTKGFVDFSAHEERAFDPRLQILFVLLPIRVLPVLAWLWFRHKPVPSIIIAAVTILTYAVFS